MCISKGTRNRALVSESSGEKVQISRWVMRPRWRHRRMDRILLTSKNRQKKMDVNDEVKRMSFLSSTGVHRRHRATRCG